MEFLKHKVNSLFKGKQAWEIALRTTVAAGAAVGAVYITSDIQERGLGEVALSIAKSLPFVGDIIRGELKKNKDKAGAMALTAKEVLEYKVNTHLPEKGLSKETLMVDFKKWYEIEKSKYMNAGISGTVYHGEPALVEFLGSVYTMFALSNPLHPSTFPFVQKMESEMIAMTLKLFRGESKDHCGVTTTGGTESILMAMRGYKERAKGWGITKPEIVACVTAHAAFDKAADYFGMKLVHVPFEAGTYKIDLRKARKAITRNTVVVVCLAPCYAQGVIDPVSECAAMIKEIKDSWGYNIGLHVDCCLGGFFAPFVRLMGKDKSLPDFDFSVPGVTSISADVHKYGYSPKGVSVLMFSSPELRSHIYFTAPAWTGGIYATPTMTGSRAGGLVAAAWAAMMHLGMDGYLSATREILSVAHTIKNGVKDIPGIEVMGDPVLSVIALRSSDPDLNIYAVNAAMGHEGGHTWELSAHQNPSCIHLCITFAHKGKGDQFVKDLKESVEHVRANKELYAKKSSVAIYGTTQSVPSSMIGEISKAYIDALFKLPQHPEEKS